MEQEVTVKISPEEAKEMQDILNIEEGRYLGSEKDTLKTYSVVFAEGYEADIKVCNGNTPFVDAVLFKNGSEVQVLEIREDLLGEYLFKHAGNEFTVNIVLDEGLIDRTNQLDDSFAFGTN